jgi:hypothetical protein
MCFMAQAAASKPYSAVPKENFSNTAQQPQEPITVAHLATNWGQKLIWATVQFHGYQ